MLFRPIILFICATWFVLPAVLFAQQDERPNPRSQCLLTSISQYLDDPEKWGDRQRNILAFADFGPELLYRTKHSVYSIANHRFQRGFTDSYNIMSSSTDGAALEIIKKRRVDLVLICMPVDDELYVRADGRETFYDRISKGKIPSWMRQDLLPNDIPEDFRLYEVRLP